MSARDYFIARAIAHDLQAQAYDAYREAELIAPGSADSADRAQALADDYRAMSADCLASAEREERA